MLESKVKALSLHYGAQAHVPVDPFLIASKAHITVYHTDCEFSDRFGIIRTKNEGQTLFYLASNWDQAHQRFFLAHLLGHYFLHLNQEQHADRYCRIRYNSDPSAGYPEEQEADEFARFLLIPSHALSDCLNQRLSVEEIATHLMVPSAQVKARLNELKRAQNPSADPSIRGQVS
ncbi:ImmA/IrrE family metallo-endopeptidase [Sporolactobacillus terrae]|uniref:IrrE N-terminal-like domain-containing protein n=1 Tax=Sporolactobacillus terrae TaxID=269673 RepID=A0A5K7WYM4_9BACL|nr:ImmA/IrrE family metallo-endopeptidase [Sporolactobacillus terrae]UAK16250.1 ImmA/IrrE family metallo-endopeptidase [Sporolactobacillus terrae]BBN97718.1 hypothetical protein St703_04230 [Sporolactobacillus terrae]